MRSLKFKCPKCGEYDVSKETFDAFTTPTLQARVEKAFAQGAIKAIAEFDKDCPRCKTKGHQRIVTVKVIRPKK